MKNGTATLEESLTVSYKVKHSVLPYDLAMTLLDIYPNELKMYTQTKACTQMFTTALFIIAKNWKQPRCPSIGEWIYKLWYI